MELAVDAVLGHRFVDIFQRHGDRLLLSDFDDFLDAHAIDRKAMFRGQAVADDQYERRGTPLEIDIAGALPGFHALIVHDPKLGVCPLPGILQLPYCLAAREPQCHDHDEGVDCPICHACLFHHRPPLIGHDSALSHMRAQSSQQTQAIQHGDGTPYIWGLSLSSSTNVVLKPPSCFA